MSKVEKKTAMERQDISAAQLEYVRKLRLRNKYIRICQIIILISFILLWEITAFTGILNSFIFSSPSRIIGTILSMASDGELFYHMGITLLETLISFFLVNFLGIIIAIILWWNIASLK